MPLKRIPDKVFEIAGILIGSSASVFIVLQIAAELKDKNTSSLSAMYVLGFLIIYIFWAIYGIKYKRPAMWLTNGMASTLQLILLVIISFVK